MQGQNQGPRAGKERSAPVDLAPYPNCSNICFLGTNVVSGTATAVVIATGARTYFASLAVRLRWRYSVDLPLPPRRSADNPAALPSRRDFFRGATASPSIRQECACSAETASRIAGKRADQL